MADGTQVGSLYYDLNVDDKNLKGQLDDADQKVASFGEKIHGGLIKAAKGFAVMGAGLTLISKNATDFTVDLVKSSKSLGVQIGTTTEEASRLVAAFGRMGISAGDASAMFGIFSKNIKQATEDSKDSGLAMEKAQIEIDKTRQSIQKTTDEIHKNGDKTGELTLKLKDLNNQLATQQAALTSTGSAFQRLGVSTVDANGNQKTFNQILFDVADKFKAMPNGIDKTTAALELFGRSGKDMIRVLNLGSDGIKELEAQADKLGITLTTQNIAAVSDYIKSQKDLKESTDAVKVAIGTTTAPVLANFNKSLNDVILKLLDSHGAMKTLTVDFLAFAGPVFGGIAALASFGASLAQIASVIGAVVLGSIVAVIAVLAAFGIAIFEALTHMEELGAFVVTVTDNISMAFRDMWNTLKENIALTAAAFSDGISNMVYFFQKGLQRIRDDILGFAAGAWHWLYNAGSDIVSGLVQGIKDRVGDAVNAVKNVGKSIVNAARSALDWHSPSKIFIEAGRSISEGMAIGINKSAGMALSAMDALSNSVISPSVQLSPSNAGAGGAGNSTSYGDTVVNIGQINNAQDEAYVLRRLDRNQDLEGKGMSPSV